jgi:hypothetical protein
MRLIRTLTAFAATVGAAAAFAVAAQASSTQPINWKQMTLKEVIAAQRGIIAKDKVVLSWYARSKDSWTGVCQTGTPLAAASTSDPTILNGKSVIVLPGTNAAALARLSQSGHATDAIRKMKLVSSSRPIWLTLDGNEFSTDGTTWNSTETWPWRDQIHAMLIAQHPGVVTSAPAPRSLAAFDAVLVTNTTALTTDSVQRACTTIQKDQRFHAAQVRWVAKSLTTNVVRLKKQEEEARAISGSVGNTSAWECIHSHEGSWTDSGDPFWGGLQMDRGFMETYGADMIRKYGGYANLWSPQDQMIVAQRAYSSGRGYGPWPNTAQICGLL